MIENPELTIQLTPQAKRARKKDLLQHRWNYLIGLKQAKRHTTQEALEAREILDQRISEVREQMKTPPQSVVISNA